MAFQQISEKIKESKQTFSKIDSKIDSKVDSLIESHLSLKNDYISLQSELASIKKNPNFNQPIQSENTQNPPVSGHEERSAKPEVCIKENLSSVTNHEIIDKENIDSTQSIKIIPAATVPDTKVNSLSNNLSMDNSQKELNMGEPIQHSSVTISTKDLKS